MVLDFGKLNGGDGSEVIAEPRKIFATLPSKSSRFKFLHDVQSDVLAEWFDRRNDPDLILKMNTGSGKTLVGLLLLKSSLNEGVGPAAFIVPDNFLVHQVTSEANDLGIEVTNEPSDADFRQGKSILVTNVHKLFNGRSVFGVWDAGTKIPLGTVVIDDAHASISTIRDQFTLRIGAENAAYTGLIALVENEIKKQSFTTFIDIQNADPQAYIEVPFWVWQDNTEEITRILHSSNQSDDEFIFKWPFLRHIIGYCRCVVGGRYIEVSPRCIPRRSVPSFDSAKRRIYTTATLADDSALITDIDAAPASVSVPISPSSAGDIGDRMIIVPQSLNPDVTDDEIKSLVKELASTVNVVVIVPSNQRASYWSDVAAQILTSADIWDGVAKLKETHIGLSVLVNRYDGIDLPDDACRVLVIDGLPEHRGLIELSDHTVLDGTHAQLSRQVQRIEQGMGRGIRSNDDSCVVFLMGNKLVHRLHEPSARKIFTPGTLAQITLAEQVAQQIKDKPLAEIKAVIELCLNRNPDWVSASKKAVVDAKYEKQIELDPVALALREAFDLLQIEQISKAADTIQAAVNSCNDPHTKGWLMIAFAEVLNRIAPPGAQEVVLSALRFNPRLVKPIDGIAYSKLSPPAVDQGVSAVQYLSTRFLEGNALLIGVNGLVDDLKFQPETAKRFESAMKSLGAMLGYGSQRPEIEFGDGGPDNLWAGTGGEYFVIECKNGAVSDAVSKSDANQLAGSINWFRERYGTSAPMVPLLVHPSCSFIKEATPPPGVRVIDQTCLEKLIKTLKQFAKAAAAENAFLDSSKMGALFDAFALTPQKFIDGFTVGGKPI